MLFMLERFSRFLKRHGQDASIMTTDSNYKKKRSYRIRVGKAGSKKGKVWIVSRSGNHAHEDHNEER